MQCILYAHACMYARVHIHTGICTSTRVRICIYTFLTNYSKIYINIPEDVHVHTYVCVCVCVCVCVYSTFLSYFIYTVADLVVCVCVCVCVCVYTGRFWATAGVSSSTRHPTTIIAGMLALVWGTHLQLLPVCWPKLNLKLTLDQLRMIAGVLVCAGMLFSMCKVYRVYSM